MAETPTPVYHALSDRQLNTKPNSINSNHDSLFSLSRIQIFFSNCGAMYICSLMATVFINICDPQKYMPFNFIIKEILSAAYLIHLCMDFNADISYKTEFPHWCDQYILIFSPLMVTNIGKQPIIFQLNASRITNYIWWEVKWSVETPPHGIHSVLRWPLKSVQSIFTT